jgi:hypothetical protein
MSNIIMISERPRPVKDKEQIDRELGHSTYIYMTKLCDMVDDFSEKWSDVAQNPKRFLEVAQELKKLKKEIAEFVAKSNNPKYPPEERLEKWMYEFYIKTNASKVIQEQLGLPLSGKKIFKEELEQFVLMEPSKIIEMRDEMTAKKFAKNPEHLKKLDDIVKRWGYKDGLDTKLPKSSVQEAKDEALFHKIDTDTAIGLKNLMMNYAIILDALAGGADKPVEEQIKDLKFIVRKKGERQGGIPARE